MTNQYRPDIETPPETMRGLPVDRGYPVPWFVAWVDGKPEFRCADGEKRQRAVTEKLCWVCGRPLGAPPRVVTPVVGFERPVTFVIGPMCGVNRTTAEPPCHHECALYSAKNCPFLSKPQMVRREGGLPAHQNTGGEMIMRNPGVSLLWTTRGYAVFPDGAGGWLIRIGKPLKTEWYALGQPATRAQVEESVRTGLPILVKMAEQEGPDALAELRRMEEFARRYWPET